MSEPLIRTEVVGSYPTPSWLSAMPSKPALRDALLVVLKTQELAGIDVVSDGELARFDVNHPDTNGMIEFFIRPLTGISTELTTKERNAFEAQSGTANAMVIDISNASDVLDMAFYLQGLIIAMVPALVGFAGSRQYLERESESEESEKSATPLWIGVLIFLAVFFMMIG